MQKDVNRELLHRSLLRAERYAPGISAAPIVRTWVGLRPYSIDNHPLIGPWDPVKGFYIAAGHEGLGISMAPITGLLLAQHHPPLHMRVRCAAIQRGAQAGAAGACVSAAPAGVPRGQRAKINVVKVAGRGTPL